MASGVTGSVSVALHPLVILNISDHWIRMRSQEGRPMQGECRGCVSSPPLETASSRVSLPPTPPWLASAGFDPP